MYSLPFYIFNTFEIGFHTLFLDTDFWSTSKKINQPVKFQQYSPNVLMRREDTYDLYNDYLTLI